MGSCEFYSKCPNPKCGEDVCHIVYTNGEEYVGCLNPECSYGWKIRWVEVDGKMTLAMDIEKAQFSFVPIANMKPITDFLMEGEK